MPLAKAVQLVWFDGWDWLRQLLLVAAVVGIVAAVIAPGTLRDAVVDRELREWSRRERAAAVLWTLLPAVAVWAVVLGYNQAVMHNALAMEPGQGCRLLDDSGAARAACTVAVIGFGEEYLYRGLLLVLAVQARLDYRNFLLLSLSFAAWHLPDDPGNSGNELAARAVAFAATFVLSHFVLFVVRRRSRSVAGPAILHASTNLSLLLVTTPA